MMQMYLQKVPIGTNENNMIRIRPLVTVADPDPYQNVTDLQHWYGMVPILTILRTVTLLYYDTISALFYPIPCTHKEI